jgi:hypothetical protein
MATKALMDTLGGCGVLGERLGNGVSASGMVGAASWFFPVAWRGPLILGSFAAMSAVAVLGTPSAAPVRASYRHNAGAGLAGAVCHVLTSGCLAGGFGGRLGFSALMGVLVYERVLLPGLLRLRS